MKGICQACHKYSELRTFVVAEAGIPGASRELKLCRDCGSNYQAGNIDLSFIKRQS